MFRQPQRPWLAAWRGQIRLARLAFRPAWSPRRALYVGFAYIHYGPGWHFFQEPDARFLIRQRPVPRFRREPDQNEAKGVNERQRGAGFGVAAAVMAHQLPL